MSNDLTTMDATKPNGATEPVSTLAIYVPEVRLNLKDWGGTEHQLVGGRHKFPFGASANRPTTLLGAGVLYVNTDLGIIEYYDGAVWQPGLTIFPSGTRMLFDQDTAPLGWTRDVTITDRVVNIVSGSRLHGGSWVISGIVGTLVASGSFLAAGSSFAFNNSITMTQGGGWRPLSRDVIICSKN